MSTTEKNSETAAVIKLTYSLTYEESLMAFRLLSFRRSARARGVVSAVLMLLAAVLTVFYAFNPYNLEYLILPLLSLAVWAGIVVYPDYKAKRGARAVARVNGTYKVELFSEGYIRPHEGPRLPLAGDKFARGYETAGLFVLRPDHLHTFCLPKRSMNDRQIREVRKMLETHLPKFQQIQE